MGLASPFLKPVGFLGKVACETETAVVMIAGNHDSGDRIGSMSIMTDARRALIRGALFADELPLILQDEFGPVAFSALPFGYEYAARECFGDETISVPQHVMRAQISAARRHVPDGARWVVVAHAFVDGAHPSESERPLGKVGGIETVCHETFEGAHYVALGHLHRPQSVGTDHIRYSGSPLAFGFDEAGSEKSMSLVDLGSDGTTTINAIPFLPARGVKVLKGKLADLLLAEPSGDFIKCVLTDDTPMIDPMKRLRDVFPHACQITYARDEKALDTLPLLQTRAALHDPAQMISDFLMHVRNEDPADSELVLISSAMTNLRNEEIEA